MRYWLLSTRRWLQIGLLAVLGMSWSAGQDLPPEIQVDRLMVQAERESGDGDPWSAAATLDRALGLYEQHGIEIPVAFWIERAQTFQSAGMYERSVEAAVRYLREAGTEGEHYQAALVVLDTAEMSLEEARRSEVLARAELERREWAAAEREAAIASAVPEMVTVPAATLVRSFELSKYETTFAQWDVCAEFGPCRPASDEGWGRGDRPVINVSWFDAQQFVAWLSQETGDAYRLPSYEEWLHAARAESNTRYSWGRRIGNNVANCDGCGSQWDGRQTAPVGSFAANAFSLHDMHGNVWEWVQNCYKERAPFESFGPIPVGSPRERTDCDSRMYVGGGLASRPIDLRVDGRRGIRYGDGLRRRDPDRYYNVLGFRVARTITR